MSKQSGKKAKLQEPVRAQKIYESALGIGVFILVLWHMLLSMGRYLFNYYNTVRPYECWFALLLLAAALVYLLFTHWFWPETMYRIRDFFRKLFSRDQIFCMVLFVWYLISALVNQVMNESNYFKANDWWIFDTGINALVLFSLPSVLSPQKAKRTIEWLLHAVSLFGLVVAVYGLWNLFALNIVTLPSGQQIGMTASLMFCLACHYNITGAIALALILIAFYMIATQKWALKIPYLVALIIHTYILLLSNSRGAFVACLAAYAISIFLIVWHKLKDRKQIIRWGASAAVALAAAALLWGMRYLAFQLFDAVTHFSELIGQSGLSGEEVRELNNLSGRETVWLSALRTIVASPQNFIFGVTPVAVTQNLVSVGKLHFEAAHAHNEILQMGVCFGVPMMVAYVGYHVSMCAKSVKLGFLAGDDHFKGVYILPVVFLAMMILNLVEAYLTGYFSIMACLFFLFCGWMNALTKKSPGSRKQAKK